MRRQFEKSGVYLYVQVVHFLYPFPYISVSSNSSSYVDWTRPLANTLSLLFNIAFFPILLEWCRLYSTLEGALPLVDILVAFATQQERRDAGDQRFIAEMLSQMNIQVPRIVFDRLKLAIDFDGSVELGVITINSGYDAELDELRKVYDSLESYLTLAAHR
jgi:hypothetical protein